MCRKTFPLVVVITAVAGVSVAFAQGQAPSASLAKTGLLGMGAEPGFSSKSGMLDSPAILKELKMTEAQMGRLKKARIEEQRIDERIVQERRRLRKQLTDDRDQEGLAELERAQWKLLYSLTRDDERPLVAVLDSRQRARLEQLQLQCEGPWAFMRPEVQNRLKMSPEQVDAVREIFERGRQAITQSATLPGDAKPVYPGLPAKKRVELLKSKDFSKQVDNVRKQVVTARSSTMRAIAENLNKSQRTTFEKMLGDPFQFPKTSDRLPAANKAAQGEKTFAPGQGNAPANQ